MVFTQKIKSQSHRPSEWSVTSIFPQWPTCQYGKHFGNCKKYSKKKRNKEYLLLCKSCPFLKHAGCKSQAQLLHWRMNPLHLWFVWPVFTVCNYSLSSSKDLSDIHETQRCKCASNQRSHWKVFIIAPTLQLISPSESHQPPGNINNQSVNTFPWQPVTTISFLTDATWEISVHQNLTKMF